MRKVIVAIVVLVIFPGLALCFSGCEKAKETLGIADGAKTSDELKRASFLDIYKELKKEAESKADDALLTGATLNKKPDESWDGKSSLWRASFYSQNNNEVYLYIWDNGEIKFEGQEEAGKDIVNKVITGPVSVDSVDALEIARATMITRVNPDVANKCTNFVLVYSSNLKKDVWAVDFPEDHRVSVDAATGEVLEAK